MIKGINKFFYNNQHVKSWMYVAALFFNVVVFVFIGTVYMSSNSFYSQKLFNENIHNVENLNLASANAAYTYANSMGVKLKDLVSYIESRKLSYTETVEYLSAANTDPNRQFQLILSGSYGDSDKISFGDYTGISIRQIENSDGTLMTHKQNIKYNSGYYDILSSFTDVNDENFHGVCFAPEFTDPTTKNKCFAAYRHVILSDLNGNKNLYTLLLAIDSDTALSVYEIQKKYEGQSTVLVNAEGNYIIKNSDYRNVNFYDYIVNYNGLTLDRKEKITNELVTGTTEPNMPVNLFYKNHKGADCVFSAVAIENGWYSITCVPLSSFNLENDTVDYSLIILLLFLILFIIDSITIFLIGKEMSYNISVAEQATLRATEANMAKSRFLSTMSHELRTPLNAIIGLVSLSGDCINKPNILKDYLNKIDISSKLLLQLISDILDVSAIESNKMKLNNSVFDITKLITSLSAIYYDQCTSKGINFNVVLNNMHSELLVGDSGRVNQVLLNFLSNAVKYTPNGGKITLSAEQIEKNEDIVLIKFVVSDTGCGISEELKTRIFKPFERENGNLLHRYSGTGLGLSIAKSLVDLMGGKIGFESSEGTGSKFWAEISFAIPTEQEPKIRPKMTTDVHLVAAIYSEGERKYLGKILEGFGVDYTFTDTASLAIKALLDGKNSGKPYNTCIIDWRLPDLTAVDATAKIREEFDSEALRIIILAYNIAEASSKSIAAGADIVFGKPIFPSALFNLLEKNPNGQFPTISHPEQGYDLTGKRILLIEDNEMNIEIAQLILQRVGAEVEIAKNGKLGYDAFYASKPGYFDAILMDIQMPVMNGYQATEEIRRSNHARAKQIPIFAMTADAFAEDVEKARAVGMNEHISKPIVPEILYSILKKYTSR